MLDIPRFLLLGLIILNTYQVITNRDYKGSLRFVKLVPRIYLIVYYVFVLTGWYKGTGFAPTIISGAGAANGIAFMFLANIYTQWANRKYGRS